MLVAISSITVGLVGRKALYAGLPWVINRGGKYSARLACPALARRFRRGEQEGQETHHRGTEAQRLHREKLFLLCQNGISLPLDSILDGFLCVSAVDFDSCCFCLDDFRQSSREVHLHSFAGALRNHVSRRNPAEAQVANRLWLWLAAQLA